MTIEQRVAGAAGAAAQAAAHVGHVGIETDVPLDVLEGEGALVEAALTVGEPAEARAVVPEGPHEDGLVHPEASTVRVSPGLQDAGSRPTALIAFSG